MLKEHRLECRAVLLTLAGLFTLGLLEIELDSGGLGVLLGVDGFGDTGPEAEGLVYGLLFVRGENFGGNVEGGDIDDDVLIFGGNAALGKR